MGTEASEEWLGLSGGNELDMVGIVLYVLLGVIPNSQGIVHYEGIGFREGFKMDW